MLVVCAVVSVEGATCEYEICLVDVHSVTANLVIPLYINSSYPYIGLTLVKFIVQRPKIYLIVQ